MNSTDQGIVDDPVLAVTDLEVSFATPRGSVDAVRGVSLSVRTHEIVALVGESGSGKSVTSRAVLGLHPANATINGSIRLSGSELVGLSESQFRSIRGNRVAMVFQDASLALNPVFTIGGQLVDTIRANTRLSRRSARRRAVELLELVGIPEPERRFHYYPHQLSGGQKQRVVIATAISCDPELIIADEPTTALDVTVQAEILDLLRDLRDRLGTAILMITHNMGVVADLADRVVVMYHGEIVESAGVEELFSAPEADYTKELLSVVPTLEAGDPPAAARSRQAGLEEPVVEVEDLTVSFLQGWGRRFTAVDGVSLSVGTGETLAVVGESGSGKSTMARTIAGLESPTSGAVYVHGARLDDAGAAAVRKFRGSVGYVFQDPNWSLNPRRTIGDAIAAPLAYDGSVPAQEISRRIDTLLDAVRLPRSVRSRYPHELSGGQSQRVSIARAVIRSPSLLIADEPTSALDVSVQAQVLDLLSDLQGELGFACLFITHDLAVASGFADRVAVMCRGRLIESGPVQEVLAHPAVEYTQRLVASVPVADPVRQRQRRASAAAA
ncbi:dipeptide ABC transporter ATP-binding protein [Isoptericola aurantiacus]|uniref:dipeptide ABC transporter ATP-binding protein n=1 Tax=Isoptericola aurantiacus TaxID=3377839 RepID=UPI003839D6E8